MIHVSMSIPSEALNRPAPSSPIQIPAPPPKALRLTEEEDEDEARVKTYAGTESSVLLEVNLPPTPPDKHPVIFILDTSASMYGAPVDMLCAAMVDTIRAMPIGTPCCVIS